MFPVNFATKIADERKDKKVVSEFSTQQQSF